jgi:hypothetical protein
MARLTDPELLKRYHQALSEWEYAGAIELIGRAAEGLRTTLEGVTADYFKENLYRFVCLEDGEIDQVKEERHPWREQWEWHFDIRPTINGVKLYVEIRLYPESFASRAEPSVRVVQIKPA